MKCDGCWSTSYRERSGKLGAARPHLAGRRKARATNVPDAPVKAAMETPVERCQPAACRRPGTDLPRDASSTLPAELRFPSGAILTAPGAVDIAPASAALRRGAVLTF